MSKKQDSIEANVMKKIIAKEAVMKPKWFFIAGSTLLIVSTAGLLCSAVFLTHISVFLLRIHGPMGAWRLQNLVESFPLWIPILAIISFVLGTLLLKRFDFSYQKNFGLIFIGFILAVVLAVWGLDFLKVGEKVYKKGPFKGAPCWGDYRNTYYSNGCGRISK